ncbi:putative zinc finger protein [Stackebrandtia endophytica]|uniref:Putative zinc finger protein n=1 Tax=Stackebrandtia endophytica TaxID=1496996 RepID=A0A543AZ04_9ACTN|nr:zf-HC2 domain-containing protein [Stackebrandtia endophytica]TQL77809.1 putative zinc finger protein [Stackebrandtia endophytica]
MSCEFRFDAAAYVLGALDPADRARFEEHHPKCPHCSQEVRDFAGLPGILAHVPGPDPATDSGVEPASAPPEILVNVLQRNASDRRRRRVRSALITTAAAIVAAVGAVTVTESLRTPEATLTAPVALAAEFQSVDGIDIWGQAELIAMPEGTRITVDCSYNLTDNYGSRPYRLVVTSSTGDSEVAGSWQSEKGESRQVTLFTRWQPDDIARLEIQNLDGQTVLWWRR